MPARRSRTGRTLSSLRAEVDAAEARGIPVAPAPRRPRAEADAAPALKPKPAAKGRTRMVWAVCDVGGRTVATFDYASKADAEARAAELKAKGKGLHFLRAIKEPME